MSTFMPDAPVEEAVEAEIVKLVRRDVLGLRVVQNEGNVATHDINSLLHRNSVTAVQEIDYLINELQVSRERLHVASERVERELVEYAILNESVLQATRLISERLNQLNSVPDAPSIADEYA